MVSESVQARLGAMWLIVIGLIICVIYRSPWGLALGFAFIWCLFGLAKSVVDKQGMKVEGEDDMEMQPLGKIRADMTLGELLNKY